MLSFLRSATLIASALSCCEYLTIEERMSYDFSQCGKFEATAFCVLFRTKSANTKFNRNCSVVLGGVLSD
jgi:hypothetical protein